MIPRKVCIDAKENIRYYKKKDFDNLHPSYLSFPKKGEYFDEEKAKNLRLFVWQQMSINYFHNLLMRKTLYFKRFSDFNRRDERPVEFYKKAFFAEKEISDTYKKKLISQFSDMVYISCWYQSENLTDIVFKEYAKGSVGVAIGTDVETLLSQLSGYKGGADGKNRAQDELFYGDTLYLSDKFGSKLTLEHAADLITPIFLKSENHNDDREFRLAYVKNSCYIQPSRFSSMEIDPSGLEKDHIDIDIRDIKSLIKRVAIRNDDQCTMELTKHLLNYFGFQIKKVVSIDGFDILVV